MNASKIWWHDNKGKILQVKITSVVYQWGPDNLRIQAEVLDTGQVIEFDTEIGE